MAENTLQFEWIVTIKGNLEILFLDRPDVFVAGDLFWYPVEGDPKTRTAPDAMVAIGRPKGYRGSYKQWEEGGIAPQVVFEVLSPGNRGPEMSRKLKFYERFGVEEYILYDPDDNILTGCLRAGGQLVAIDRMDGWESPRLGIRFDTSDSPRKIYGPDGQLFLTFTELELRRRELARQRDDLERQLEEQRERTRRLEAKLRDLGIEP
jgi:Uma2 family endonuclease